MDSPPKSSSHQTFLLVVELRQCVFCKKRLSSWFACIRRNFRYRDVKKHCASMILLPLSYDVLDSESRELCAGARISGTFRLSVKSSNQQGVSANGSFASCLSSLKNFCHSFLVASSSLNPKTNLMQPCFQRVVVHRVPTIPVVALQNTNCFQN